MTMPNGKMKHLGTPEIDFIKQNQMNMKNILPKYEGTKYKLI